MSTRSFSRLALVLVAAFGFVVGCKGIDEKRKAYSEELQKKVPEGCEVKPSMAAVTITCDTAKDVKAAVESARGTVKSECDSLKDLKISSVVVTGKGEGWFESEIGEIAKGNCELKKR